MTEYRKWFSKLATKVESGMPPRIPPPPPSRINTEEKEDDASTATKKKVEAAKIYIEQHYKNQMRNLQERMER